MGYRKPYTSFGEMCKQVANDVDICLSGLLGPATSLVTDTWTKLFFNGGISRAAGTLNHGKSEESLCQLLVWQVNGNVHPFGYSLECDTAVTKNIFDGMSHILQRCFKRKCWVRKCF